MAVTIKQPVLRRQKTIFQARFEPSIDFYASNMRLAKRFVKHLPEWQTDSSKIQLFNQDEHCSITLAHDSVGYEQDSARPETEERFLKMALDTIPDAFELEKCTRLGFRRLLLIDVTATGMSFKDLVAVMSMKLFSTEESLRKFTPPAINDLHYRVDADDERFSYHITLGPVRKEEIPKYVQYKQDLHLPKSTRASDYAKILEKYPNLAVFLDLDCYDDKMRLRADLHEFYAAASEKVDSLASDFHSYLFDSKRTV